MHHSADSSANLYPRADVAYPGYEKGHANCRKNALGNIIPASKAPLSLDLQKKQRQ